MEDQGANAKKKVFGKRSDGIINHLLGFGEKAERVDWEKLQVEESLVALMKLRSRWV